MESYEFSNNATEDALRSGIGRLIELLGTPKFEDEVLHVAHEATLCHHLTAFAARTGARPRVLYAANMGPSQVAKKVAKEYLRKYWDLDPARRLEQSRSKQGSDVAIRIVSHDIDNGDYRDECYTAMKVADRFTIVQRRNNETVCLNFYRGTRDGPFSSRDIDRIINASDLLISLMIRQQMALLDLDEDITGSFIERLRALDPTLPPRESEVCGAIATGMTSEAIALTLGISINTVLTYRKRAYLRLGVSSQNELMRLVLS